MDDNGKRDDDTRPATEPAASEANGGEIYRAHIRRLGVEERAGLLLHLLALVPEDVQQQTSAMATAMKLERAIVRETDTLDSSWRAEVQAVQRAADTRATAAANADPFDDAFMADDAKWTKTTTH